MIYLWLVVIAICTYLIGNINFARIVAWKKRKQDITEKGSFNPGTMNMLRVYGLKLAFLTMCGEVVKGGIPALIAAFTMQHFFPGSYYMVYFIAGLCAVIGQTYPVVYKFKGGKGLAVCAGIFLFTPLWWLALILFAVNATMLYFSDIASVATLAFITEMGVALSVFIGFFTVKVSPYWWIAVVVLWLMVIMVYISHRKNLVRLVQGKENKSNFSSKIKDAVDKKKSKKDKIINAEKEIVVKENGDVVEDENSNIEIKKEDEIVIED